METKNQPKKLGKRPLSPQEKEARKKMLLTESIEQRTKRVMNPRLKRLLKGFDSLISSVNSPRYRFTEEQATTILSAIEQKSIALNNGLTQKTTKKEEQKDIL